MSNLAIDLFGAMRYYNVASRIIVQDYLAGTSYEILKEEAYRFDTETTF